MMVFNIGNSNSNAVSSNSSSTNASNSASGNINTTKNPETVSGRTVANAVDVLKNMLAGDTFSGEITSINGSEVTLKMNNGLSLQALLLDNINLTVGQNLTFMVNENTNNKISIKPMSLNEQEAMLINRALDASNLSPNKNNVQLVQQLLKQNMPIDMNTLNTYAKELSKFPGANIDTIIRLAKLEIPITQENITQFEAYKSYEHSISNELNSFSKGFGELLSSLTSTGSPADAANFSQKILSVLYSADNESQTSTQVANPDIASTLSSTHDSALHINNASIGPNSADNTTLLNGSNGELDDLFALAKDSTTTNPDGTISKTFDSSQELLSKFLTSENRNSLSQNLNDTFGSEISKSIVEDLKSGNFSAKSLMENINQLIKDNPNLNKDALDKLFNSKEFEETVKLLVRDKLRITPQDVKNADDINDFYKKVREDVSKMADTATQAGKDSAFAKSLDGLKNNIDFMNDLNKNMSYFQMPIKFSGSDGNGELYVFTNKKNLANKTDNLSALLHLDMENLGPLDVFIKLSGGTNVSTNFCLESEEMLDFVYSHIDTLTDRLESLGYHMNFEMKVKDETDDIDFINDFIDQKVATAIPTTFVFDTKA